MAAFDGFKRFLKEPFDDEMSAFDWFCFIGFLLSIVLIWRLIIGHILAEAS